MESNVFSRVQEFKRLFGCLGAACLQKESTLQLTGVPKRELVHASTSSGKKHDQAKGIVMCAVLLNIKCIHTYAVAGPAYRLFGISGCPIRTPSLVILDLPF